MQRGGLIEYDCGETHERVEDAYKTTNEFLDHILAAMRTDILREMEEESNVPAVDYYHDLVHKIITELDPQETVQVLAAALDRLVRM